MATKEPPAKAERQLTGLEKEMAALLAQTSKVAQKAEKIEGGLGQVRRKSKDLEEQLNDLTEYARAQWGNIGGRRSRHNSKEIEDLEQGLRSAFDKVDSDKSGDLSREELKQAPRCCRWLPRALPQRAARRAPHQNSPRAVRRHRRRSRSSTSMRPTRRWMR